MTGHELPPQDDWIFKPEEKPGSLYFLARGRATVLVAGFLGTAAFILFLINRNFFYHHENVSPLADTSSSSPSIISPLSQTVVSLYSPSYYLNHARADFEDAKKLSEKHGQSSVDKEEIIESITKSIETISEGIETYPNDSSLWATRADIYVSLIKESPRALDQALSDMTQAHSLSPGSVQYVLLLSKLYQMKQDDSVVNLTNALEFLWQTAARVPEDYALLRELASVQMLLGYLSQAQNTLVSLLALPNDPATHKELLVEKEALDRLVNQLPNGELYELADIQHDRLKQFDSTRVLPNLTEIQNLVLQSNIIVAADTTALSPYTDKFTSSAYSGTAVIPAGQKTLTVENIHVTDLAPVYVTPIGNTTRTISVIKKQAGTSFTVTLDAFSSASITFRYWVTRDQDAR